MIVRPFLVPFSRDFRLQLAWRYLTDGTFTGADMAFPTPLFDQLLAERQTRWESERQTVLRAALEWLQLHGGDYGIKAGYVFGSVTQAGRFTEYSDVDLAIAHLGLGNCFGLMGALSLYLNREVDLVPLDQCHFADKIRREGIAWNVKESLP